MSNIYNKRLENQLKIQWVMMILINIPLLTNAVGRHGFPLPKMVAVLMHHSNEQQRQRRHLRVYIYGSKLRLDAGIWGTSSSVLTVMSMFQNCQLHYLSIYSQILLSDSLQQSMIDKLTFPKIPFSLCQATQKRNKWRAFDLTVTSWQHRFHVFNP